MAKKSFLGGLDSLLEGNDGAGESNKSLSNNETNNLRSSLASRNPQKTRKTKTRATFVVAEEELEMLSAISFWERRKKSEVLSEALKFLFDSRRPEDLDEMLAEYRSRR